MRILVEPPLGVGDPDEPEHLERPGPRGLAARFPVQQHGLGHLIADGEDGVQARHRLLEDHAHLAAADLPHLLLRQRHEIDRPAIGR